MCTPASTGGVLACKHSGTRTSAGHSWWTTPRWTGREFEEGDEWTYERKCNTVISSGTYTQHHWWADWLSLLTMWLATHKWIQTTPLESWKSGSIQMKSGSLRKMWSHSRLFTRWVFFHLSLKALGEQQHSIRNYLQVRLLVGWLLRHELSHTTFWSNTKLNVFYGRSTLDLPLNYIICVFILNHAVPWDMTDPTYECFTVRAYGLTG